jgi:4-aminobutyrate aminotransferase-like enzyme
LSPETWGDEPPPRHVRLVDPPSASAELRRRTVEAAAADLDDASLRAAAVFVDGIFTSDGIPGAAPAWKKEALAAMRAAGGLYIADEVQAGYGRTGDHLWSFAADHLDVDLVTLGKPMGNGYPVAAVMGSADLIDPFMRDTDYFSTFGGNTAACAAALAVLRTVEQDGLTENARAVGAHLVDVLGEVARECDVIAQPRAWGLAVGVDVCRSDDGALDPEAAARLVNRMREHGILIGVTGAARATLKIRPPLVFTTAHADRLATELATSLAGIES